MNIDDKHLQPPSSITRIVDDSASDDEMVTAASNITPLVPGEKLDSAAPSQMPGGNDSMLSVDQNTEQNLGHGEIAPQGEIPATQPSMDLLDRIKGMYRLLDLVNDTAIGGSVDKVVIAQESIESLANTIQPNSYSSMTKVDFRALDKHAIRPQGVYGSKSSIVGFFEELGRLNAETRSLLLAPRDEASGTNRPFMRPGLYLVDAREADRDLFYVVFWPEETTWDDDAGSSVSRNRVTFMRYLKKLCDQLVCLISEEHAQNLVWGDEGTEGNVDDDIEDDDVNERLYAFSVEQTQSQEDSASVHEGFSFQHHSISVSNACNLPAGISSEQLLPRIVVGEQAQGILRVEYNHGEYGRSKVNMKRTRKAMINYLKSDQTPQIQLGEHITRDSLSVLLELGLGTRCGDIEASWVAQCAEESDKRASSIEDRRKADIAKVDETMRKFRASLKIWLPNQASSFFPSLSEEALIASLMEEGSPQQIGAEERNDAIRDVENTLSFASWRQNAVSSLENKLKRISEASGPDYRDIKTRCLEIRFILENSTLDEKVAQQFLDLLFSEGNFESLFNNLCASVSSSSATANQGDGIARKMWTTASSWLLGTPGKRQLVLKKMPATASIPNDISFWKSLERDARLNPAYNEAKELVGNHLIHEIKNTLIYVRNEITQKVRSVISRQMTAIREKDFEEGRKVELDDAWNRLRERMRSFFAPKIDATRSCLQITQITRETGGNRHVEESFRLIGWEIKPRLADFRYTFFPMEIKAEDLQQVSMNADHICKPGISEHRKQTFEIRVGTTLQLFRLIGKDGCIVVLQDRDSLRIFYDSLSGISNAIEKDRHKKLLHLIRIGHESLIAVEETRRHLALLSRKSGSLQINLYSYDEVSKTLASRGSAVDISEWYPGRIPSFRDFHFIPNTDELLLVEAGGMSRVFSLMTQTFRSKKVLLGPNLLSVSVTFDGASLLALYKGEDSTLQLRCLHWASFGEQPGIQLPVPAWASSSKSVALSSVGNRKNNQLIFLDPDQSQISSLFIKISCKSSAFTFKANKHDTEHVKRRVTVNNSLIDCHADVWTRFPIAPPIRRELSTQAIARPSTIHFVSKWPIPMLEAYFRTMVTDFESKTRKPTDGILHKIQVSTAAQWSPHGLNKEITVSQLGDWLVGLMCLIPIHLAVTGSNRFIPLKDGVNNNEFEGQLLGASVMQIVQNLSFGWYESIFNSYLADLPVKVVTSMGEQSVGKSYALNHFVDTSFAGSAMRCTEGVWLSVTPTREYLVVAMDFEGVQSIERSPQEDMLLVLLNTAISNFVLFRNNFALSRNIADLFASFQSCISVLDPASNPKLFQSRLEIIIKDVIASDTEEMVKEFSLKFDRIVKEEGADNFITKLHKGHLGIIPWPVIESSLFYKLFNSLRKRFMRQPVTHPHGGAFLVLLKTLMAKLKANDWGALDQNLAAQRAQYLLSIIDDALCFGLSEPSSGEQLKNCDNDQPIPNNSGEDIFFLQDVKNPSDGKLLDIDICLAGLRTHWSEHLRRYRMTEQEYVQSYQNHLESVSTTRVNLVHEWLKVNTSRFPASNADIGNVFRVYEEKVKELKLMVVPCMITCSSCGLLCLRQKYHNGNHDCMTNHKCHTVCEFADDHSEEEIPPCDMPAGHEGRHVCTTKSHLCGRRCQMNDKDGCLQRCYKPLNHDQDDPEHTCAAKVHACGAPCDLIKPDGTPICNRKCITDCRRTHQRHCCENSFACPIKCQLCGSFCAVGDHFHALQSSEHLCGQPHACKEECQLQGICEIASAPHSVQSMFRGKHSVFSYTKYTQEARKSLCGIQIPPGMLTHEGMHMHLDDPDAFHFCEARCTHCGYYCTLKLGHPDDEHRTQHGSMENAEWLIEGEEDAILELQGRTYGTGDSGAPMLCSMVCKSLGRHAHVSRCRAEDALNCDDPEVEHIKQENALVEYDWISHKTFWARSGFEDPYTHAERVDFELCDRRCGGEEHDPDLNHGALPSFCTLPLFHPPADLTDVPGLGHISHDGHAYTCKNPALMQRSFHIFFALDRSGSMTSTDHRPLPDTPASQRIATQADNRFGAVLSAVYNFWVARDAATRGGIAAGLRQDAYTVVFFDHTSTVACSSDIGSSPDDLLTMVPPDANWYGGTDYTTALKAIQKEMEDTWSTDRYPLVIFLSDGECTIHDDVVYDLCRTAVRLGKPLGFHTVSFGEQAGAQALRRMAAVAKDVFDEAPEDPLAPISGAAPCTYNEALDTIQLADTFVKIAKSLKNPRAALRA